MLVALRVRQQRSCDAVMQSGCVGAFSVADDARYGNDALRSSEASHFITI